MKVRRKFGGQFACLSRRRRHKYCAKPWRERRRPVPLNLSRPRPTTYAPAKATAAGDQTTAQRNLADQLPGERAPSEGAGYDTYQLWPLFHVAYRTLYTAASMRASLIWFMVRKAVSVANSPTVHGSSSRFGITLGNLRITQTRHSLSPLDRSFYSPQPA